jgi:predicted ester cyclase
MNAAETRQRYEAYAAAKNSGQLDRAMEFCDRTITYRSASAPDAPTEGWEAVRAYYAALEEGMPGYRVEREGIVVQDETVVAWGRLRGTVGEKLMGIEAPGRELDFPILFVCRFRDGLLVEETGWFDSQTMAAQLGIDDGTSEDQQDLDSAEYKARWEKAWEEPTADRLIDLWHPDIDVRYPSVDEPMDREAAREFWRGVFELMPDFRIEATNWIATGNEVVIELAATATVKGEALSWGVVDVVTLRGSKPISIRGYGDVSKVTEALGTGTAGG